VEYPAGDAGCLGGALGRRSGLELVEDEMLVVRNAKRLLRAELEAEVAERVSVVASRMGLPEGQALALLVVYGLEALELGAVGKEREGDGDAA